MQPISTGNFFMTSNCIYECTPESNAIEIHSSESDLCFVFLLQYQFQS